MAGVIISMVIGYVLGSLNPAALIAAVKKKNLRESGTKNLGATNVTMTIGKGYGALVMLFDILKAFFAVKIADVLFPDLALSGLIAGCCAVIGHVFPAYMKFKGGKGLAAFGGMILAFDPGLFLRLLILGIVLILITNYGIALTFSAAAAAPFWAGYRAHSVGVFGVMLVASGLIIFKHWENIAKLKEGSEVKVRDFLKDQLKK